jgi:hypothetical protein
MSDCQRRFRAASWRSPKRSAHNKLTHALPWRVLHCEAITELLSGRALAFEEKLVLRVDEVVYQIAISTAISRSFTGSSRFVLSLQRVALSG